MEVAARLDAADRVLLTSHITPDGDGLGSALALRRALERRGKDVAFVNCSSSPQDLRFLTRRGEFHVYDPKRHDRLVRRADVIVATDLGGVERLGKMQAVIEASPAERILLDHHEVDPGCFAIAHVDRSASCTAEIVWDLLDVMDVPLTEDLAEPLFAGLVTDTGWFAYSQTGPRAHRMAESLHEAGVRPARLWRHLHCSLSIEKLRFLGASLARLETAADGRLVSIAVRGRDLAEFGIAPRDGFEVVNHMLRLKTAEVALFLMEIDGERTKISLRSSGRVDVCGIARRYGGGGHRFAAGCVAVGFDLASAHVRLTEQLEELIVANDEATAEGSEGGSR